MGANNPLRTQNKCGMILLSSAFRSQNTAPANQRFDHAFAPSF
jgi:hypothetical protein